MKKNIKLKLKRWYYRNIYFSNIITKRRYSKLKKYLVKIPKKEEEVTP
jgi:hypothetical protein